IPFQLPETTLQFLQDRRRTGGPAAVTYGDDGEKFGGWPDTWDWVYGQGYLEKWFATLEANADWLETTHFAGYMDTHPPSGRVYLPPASYEEMMEWALPVDTAREFKNLKERLAGPEEMADEAGRFLHGGVWDSFLTKYVEANQLHKKMLHVSRKVGQMEPGAAAAAEARAELYRGQCNCAYWHGMFGGLYLNYLRHAVYHHLIRAESLAEANLRPAGGLTVEWLDFDLDGQVEVVVTHPQMSAEVAPARGGALVELDFRPAAFNLLNVLTRREEIYHDRIRQGEVPGAETGEPRSIHDRVRLQDPALADALIYDRLDRLAFMDHLLPADISLEQLQSGSFADRADLAGHPYLAAPSPPLPPDNPFRLHLTRATGAGPGGPPITLTKSYTFDPVRARVQVDYHLASQGNQPLVGVWGVEFNFTLLAGDAADRYYCLETQEDRRLISAGEIQQTSRFAARDEWSGFEIRWTLAPAARVVRFPIETVSQSEDGFEKTYQGSCLWFLWDLELEPGGEREWTVELAVEKIQPAGA
ncbi:MAG: alpha-amylase/4-alpha-glucanotransferase domain-containing protein, partial [Nitrospinaceae bacterium]